MPARLGEHAARAPPGRRRRTRRRRPRARRRRDRATLPFRTSRPSSWTSRRRDGDGAGRELSGHLGERGGVRLGVERWVEGDERRQAGLQRARSARRGRPSTEWSAACSAAMITFLLFGRSTTSFASAPSIAATRSAVDGFIVSPPSTTTAPTLSNSARFPSPAATATTAVRRSAAGTACSSRSSRSSVCSCMFAISTPPIVPRATPSDSARPGSSVWTCTLSAVRSPTTSSESPICSSSVSSARQIEVVALDDEHGAVAEARELLVDRVDADRALRAPALPAAARRRRRQRCRARSRRARRRPRRRRPPPAAPAASRASAATISSPAATISGSVDASLGRVRQRADRGEHRPFDRLLDRAVGGVARRAKRLARGRRSPRASRSRRARSARGSRPSCRARPSAPRGRPPWRGRRGRRRRRPRAPRRPRGRSGSGSCRCRRREPDTRSDRRSGAGAPRSRRGRRRRAP